MLRQVAGMFGEEKRIDRIAAGWRDGRSIVWTRAKDPGDYVALSAVRFDSEDQARAYFGFGVDLQRKRDEQSSATSTGALGRIIESKYHAVTWPKCQEGLRNEKTLAAPAGGGHRPAAVVLVRSGTLVVEVSWQGRHAQMDWARQQVDVVLSRLARQ